RRALAGLEAAHARVWLLVYPQAATSPLRIAHAFIADPRGFVSRGSGSWASWAGAVSGALFEAVQLRAEHERFLACPEARLDDNATAYGAWASPQIVRELTSYLDAQPREVVDDDPRAKQAWVERSETGAPFPRSPSRRSKQWPRATPGRKGRPLGRTAGLELDQWPRDRRSELSVSQLYGELLESFTRQGRALLVAELPSPIADWTAVRVLIPKATTHQAASRSRGGERLENATFLYGVPT
ncbi:MAG: YcaO-like family protein, partial [Polyangiaceae bacterium]